jgi:histidine ammonia-lyase
MKHIFLTGENLTIEQVIQAARQDYRVEIQAETWQKVRQSRAFLEKEAKSGRLIYAINTGFGSNASEIISPEHTTLLQRNLLISHACGVGAPFRREIVRAIMLIRLNTLLAGYSGIQESTLRLLQSLLNEHIHPVIPSQGSVGASGDLCPLSHMAIALIGEGEVEIELIENEQLIIKRLSAQEALKAKGLKPVILQHKEGIALNNGTSVMTALGVFGVFDSLHLIDLAVQTSSLAFEGLLARKQAFDSKVHQIRRHQGQQYIAQQVRDCTEGSTFFGLEPSEMLRNIPQNLLQELPKSVQIEIQDFLQGKPHKFSAALYKSLPDEDNLPRWRKWETIFKLAEKKLTPQDAYSVRCIPQVLGASLQAILHTQEVIENELNAVVDNPLLFEEEGEILSAGNFHGQPVALALDYLKLAIAEVGNIIERQNCKLTDAANNDLLPPFLVENAGLNSGFMIPQYVCASLVAENKVLVHPASADSIPTSANQEDHVSMGTIAGRQALEMLENVRKILAIHALTAAQALDLRRLQLAKIGLNLQLGAKTQELYTKIRTLVPYLAEDRLLDTDIRLVSENLSSGSF